jgi:hypothetical protein
LADDLRESEAEQACETLRARAENAGHHPAYFAPYGRDPHGRPSLTKRNRGLR